MQKTKINTILCLMLFLTFCAYAVGEICAGCYQSCTDSDGKNNFTVSGWCNGSRGYVEDNCSGDYALDYYCQLTCGNCAKTNRYCEYGCSEGVCNPQPTTTTILYPACSDGIKNQGEIGLDCGGPCPACETELPDVFGSIPGHAGGGNLLIFPVLLLLVSGIYYVSKKRGREIEREYEHIIDSVLEERGLG